MTKLTKFLLIAVASAWVAGAPTPLGLLPDAAAVVYAETAPADTHDDHAADTHATDDHADHGDAHHTADVVDTSKPNIAVFVWQLILFIVFFAVLAKFVWPPILKGLKGREEKMRSDLVGAEKAREDAQAALAEYKAKIAEAQKEAAAVVEEARKSAQQVAAKLKAETESEIASMRDRAAAEIESAKKQALSDVYAQTAELSTAIAGRILKREISAADQQQLVSDSLAELTKSGV